MVFGNEEYLGRADKTLQVAINDNGHTLYVLNMGDGYESIFGSFEELSNYLEGRPFNRLASFEVHSDKIEEFIKTL